MAHLKTIKRFVDQDVIDQNIPGPTEDREGSKTTHFMNVNARDATSLEAVTIFESPYYNARQHPVECFHFHFAISVRKIVSKISVTRFGENLPLWQNFISLSAIF